MIQSPCQCNPFPPAAPESTPAAGIPGPDPTSGHPPAYRPRGLLPARNTHRRVRTTGLLACLACLAAAAGQPKPSTPTLPTSPALPPIAPPTAQPATPAPGLPALITPALPADPAGSMAAFGQVREWVAAMKVPEAAPEGMLAAPTACVTLRFLGEVIGRGVDASGDATTIWKAAREALAAAVRKLPVPDDALADQRRRDLAGQITITLEVAGALVPLRESTYDDIDEAVSPGRYGVAAKAGDKIRVMFPSSMLATGALPGQGLATVVGEVLGDPAKGLRMDPQAQPSKVTARDGVSLYKFAVSAIAQPRPGDPGLFLFRGGRVISVGDVTHSNLKSMARGIADHLIARIHAPPSAGEPFLGVRGAYYPVSGKHDPDVAPPSEQAMVAYALTAWAAYNQTPTSPRDTVASLLAGTFAPKSMANPAPDIRSAALALAAVHAASAAGIPVPAEDLVAPCLSTARTTKELSMAGLLVLGLSTSPADRAIAARFADTMYIADAKGQLPDVTSHMPWLVLAERNLGGGAVRKEAVPILRAFRQKAYAYVMTQTDAGEENPDMIGGVLFPGVKPPLPTAQSLRVLAALAMLLADPNVTPREEFDRELIRFMPCLRFVRQLCADEWTEAIARDIEATRWGVRAAPWDPRMPGEASALALITVTETLAALERPKK